jgi:hypothetical protein
LPLNFVQEAVAAEDGDQEKEEDQKKDKESHKDVRDDGSRGWGRRVGTGGQRLWNGGGSVKGQREGCGAPDTSGASGGGKQAGQGGGEGVVEVQVREGRVRGE